MKVRFHCRWYRFWMGLQWDKLHRRLHVFPIPCFGVSFHFSPWDLPPESLVQRVWEDKLRHEGWTPPVTKSERTPSSTQDIAPGPGAHVNKPQDVACDRTGPSTKGTRLVWHSDFNPKSRVNVTRADVPDLSYWKRFDESELGG